MKCVLCGAVLRGAGSLLCGKYCACGKCVKTYGELEEAGGRGNKEASKLLKIARAKIDAYKEHRRLTSLMEKAVAHAKDHWTK